jgi:hypothetical protein
LKRLSPYLSKPLLDIAEEAVKRKIHDDYRRDEIRASILIRRAELGHSDEALTKVCQMTRVEFKAEVLAGVSQYLDSAQRDDALKLACEIGKESWNEKYQAAALKGLAPYLSNAQLERALEAAQSMDNADWRQKTLAALAARLKELHPSSLYPLWRKALATLANRTRAELLGDLRTLAPVIGALGGAKAIAQTCESIQDLGRWSWMPR